jgi:hypothetical protein
MKRFMLTLVLVLVAAFSLAACKAKPTAEQKVSQTLKNSNIYPLNAEERQLASINAKAFFEKEWPVIEKDEDGNKVTHKERGYVTLIRPSDSNSNGLVTTIGMVPLLTGGYKEITMYCGYRPELVGCSNEDTVAK